MLDITKTKQNHIGKPAIAPAEPNTPLNYEILLAYGYIVKELKEMLLSHISREKRKYAEFQHPHQLKNTTRIREFVCSFCSVIVTNSNGECLLTIIIGKEAYQKGEGLSSNALLRVAFKHTMQANTKLKIEQCLDIKFNSNSCEYFKRRMDEYEQ